MNKVVLHTIGQVCLIGGLTIFSHFFVDAFRIPIPANVFGMLLLLLLISCRVVKVEWFKFGANWLLAEMLLFFIPAVESVMNYKDLLLTQGSKIILLLFISTSLVMVSTAIVVDQLFKVEKKLKSKKGHLDGTVKVKKNLFHLPH
ncbi:CidA/LrgA family protein [Vibrio sp. SS-MA-C1-2]|uniref:CidA/LrgA family protein n=1 Tax=Vibrio sp. SS-MA-C1-2 TaxID=2908646 RepID=UPI001F25A754|nr:CidA/LrgA family protein [Vibrio sp. SS-MA-C1-2]UJF18281.1 CidA/LrgA family protein [Vibrio sp. SS-MA-C1-2]